MKATVCDACLARGGTALAKGGSYGFRAGKGAGERFDLCVACMEHVKAQKGRWNPLSLKAWVTDKDESSVDVPDRIVPSADDAWEYETDGKMYATLEGARKVADAKGWEVWLAKRSQRFKFMAVGPKIERKVRAVDPEAILGSDSNSEALTGEAGEA